RDRRGAGRAGPSAPRRAARRLPGPGGHRRPPRRCRAAGRHGLAGDRRALRAAHGLRAVTRGGAQQGRRDRHGRGAGRRAGRARRARRRRAPRRLPLFPLRSRRPAASPGPRRRRGGGVLAGAGADLQRRRAIVPPSAACRGGTRSRAPQLSARIVPGARELQRPSASRTSAVGLRPVTMPWMRAETISWIARGAGLAVGIGAVLLLAELFAAARDVLLLVFIAI